MLGSPESERKKGIIPRSLEEIFNLIKNDKENVYQMKIGYIQIYMEMVMIKGIAFKKNLNYWQLTQKLQSLYKKKDIEN